MAGTRQTITLDEKIVKAQEAGEKKVRYDVAVKELRMLLLLYTRFIQLSILW